mmetsp:Transcript_10006/g.17429  ORF Transcript_10006/g.17429 Transcript_10006/m.17429 type:complete len:316 (+) Transcript_10006:249-1196(+)
MGYNDGTPGKVLDGVLECPQGVHVQIVGRLVEEEQVAAALDELGHVEPVALASRELADELLLVGAAEVVEGAVGAGLHGARAQLDRVLPLTHLVVHRLLRVEGVPHLVRVHELHRGPDVEGARVGSLDAGHHLEQGRLPRTVPADHTNHSAPGEVEAEVLEQQPVVVRLRDAVGHHDFVAEPGAGRDEDLGLSHTFTAALLQQLLVPRQPRLVLRLPSLGRHLDPLELALQGALACLVRLLLLCEPLGLLVQPRGVVALPRDASAAIELKNPAGHVVEEVPVVGDGDDGALEVGEELLQPRHALRVQVVCRLVQE